MIGINIKNIRTIKGLSQQEVAKSAGISYEYLNKIENLKMTNPSSKTLQKIAKALNVSVEEFFDDENKSASTIDKDEFTPEQRMMLDKIKTLSHEKRMALLAMIEAFEKDNKE